MRALLLVAAAAALFGCGSPGPEASRSVVTSAPRFGDLDPHEWIERTPWNYPVHGVDVSKWQGTVDWPTVLGSGASFAFIKATEGADHTDDRFMENWRAAGAAGMPRGAYHFYYFCSSAADQAAWFIRNVPREKGAMPPVLDMEWNRELKTCPYFPQPAEIRAEMGVFLDIVGRYYGQKPIVYVTPDFFHENDLGRMQGVTFWLRSVAGHPSAVYPGQEWGFWQYTGTGQVPGIQGKADINAFSGTAAEWRSWLAKHTL